ncbi:MAG TPA: glycosyltransferase family 39 protein [Galbitalea sp.]|jgi:hypothetical protein
MIRPVSAVASSTWGQSILRWWQPAAAILVALVAVTAHLTVAITAKQPVYWEDEAGYLLNAQVISGYGKIPSLQGLSYYPGWSLFLVPLWWIFRNPDTVYHAATILSALFGIALGVPLAMIARRFGITWPQAVIAAGVVVLGPGRVLMSNFALSENCLAFFFALACWFALRYASSPTWGRAVVFGIAAGYTFVIHGRAVPVVIATGIWFIWRIIRDRNRWPGIAGLVSLGVIVGSGELLYRWSSSLIAQSTRRESVGISKLFGSNPLGVVFAGSGQVWFQVAASLGLVAFGLVAIAILVRREVLAKSPAVAFWVSIALLGVAAISFTYVSQGVSILKGRLDIYVYGRYLDPFLAVVTLAGAVLILKILSRRLAIWMAVSVGAFAVIYTLIGRAIIPNISNGGWWAPLNVLGLLQWNWPGSHGSNSIPLAWPTLALLVALVVIVLLRKWPTVILLLFAVFLAFSSVVAEKDTLRPFAATFYNAFSLRHVVEKYDKQYTVTFDTNGLDNVVPAADTVSRNAYQYWLVPDSPEVFDSSKTAPTSELVISRPNWPYADKYGARLIAVDTGFKNALWVLPGKLQDKLAESGKLLPQPAGG